MDKANCIMETFKKIVDSFSKLIVSVNRINFFKLIFVTFSIYGLFFGFFYKDFVIEQFTDSKEYVSVDNMDCVTNIVYNITQMDYVIGVEMFIFQPKSPNKQFADRIFSKTKNMISTPKSIDMSDIYETYNSLKESGIHIKDGDGKSMIDFCLSSTKEDEKAYIFKVESSDGGVLGMLVVYANSLLDSDYKSIVNTAKYTIKFCQ